MRFSIIENIKSNKKSQKIIIFTLILIIISIISCCIVSSNEGFYKKTIAKITAISEKSSYASDANGKTELTKTQDIKAVIMNGSLKGKEIQLQNITSYSQVNDLNLKVNDEVFISVNKDSAKGTLSAKINDFKRDKYIVYISIIFVALILIIGGLKGFRSLISLLINIIIFLAATEVFELGGSITFSFIAASILFISISIAIVCGFNKKALASVIATLIGTAVTMMIAVLVIELNHWSGIHFEEMEFLTHPPEQIFIMELLVGTLGAIMDIAISITSSITEIYDKNPDIDMKALVKSGREIGKDIMGTMANTLIFAYFSGSIPIIILLFRNGFPIFDIININLSLEITRALTGSIGIVLCIPITIFTSAAIYKKHTAKEAA